MKIINTDKAPAAIGPYSQAIAYNGLLYTSGQIPIIAATGQIIAGGISEQAKQVMENLGEILKEAGTCFENVIKATCFLANMEDFAEFNDIYGQYFINKPARSCVEVKELPKKVLCEVEVIAKL